jgi:hypothetical protein
VIYWEGPRSVVFAAGWGVEPPVTIVPDAVTWDRQVPPWLRGRHDEVVERLQRDNCHVVREQRDDSSHVPPLDEVGRSSA